MFSMYQVYQCHHHLHTARLTRSRFIRDDIRQLLGRPRPLLTCSLLRLSLSVPDLPALHLLPAGALSTLLRPGLPFTSRHCFHLSCASNAPPVFFLHIHLEFRITLSSRFLQLLRNDSGRSQHYLTPFCILFSPNLFTSLVLSLRMPPARPTSFIYCCNPTL